MMFTLLECAKVWWRKSSLYLIMIVHALSRMAFFGFSRFEILGAGLVREGKGR